MKRYKKLMEINKIYADTLTGFIKSCKENSDELEKDKDTFLYRHFFLGWKITKPDHNSIFYKEFCKEKEEFRRIFPDGDPEEMKSYIFSYAHA